MSASITLLHNPRCSKSRAALALLREHGVEPQVVEPEVIEAEVED